MWRNTHQNFWSLVGLLLWLGTAAPAAAQSPPSPSATTEPATVALDDLVREALANHPVVQGTLRRVEARRHRVPQARALPDPVLTVGWMGDPRPFGVQRDDPSSYRSFSAVQEIPYPGKRSLRGQIAEREADASWWEYEATRRRMAADVKASYYDYFYYHKAYEITLKNKDLLEKLARIAEVRYQVGKGLQQDLLKAQVEVSRLQQRLTVLEQQKATAQARLNTLLARDPEALLGPPAPVEPAALNYTLDSLYQLARESDPEAQQEARLVERQQLAVNLARKEYYPDFSVGYTYQNRPLLPEMHGFAFSVKLPLFYKWKQREGVSEATAELLSVQRSRDARLTTLAFEVKEQYLAAKASHELAQLYSRALVPQSTLALESALAAYETGQVDFLTLVSNFSTILDYEIGYYRELTSYQTALARLEPLVGVELTK